MADEESTVQSADGTELCVYQWKASKKPKAQLVIAHGYLEHARRYDEFAKYLSQKHSIAVVCYDFRGHGKSSGARGYCNDWKNYHQDLEAVLEKAIQEENGTPLFVLGHSNGGLLALDYFSSCSDNSSVKGLLISSPFLGPAAKLSYIKKLLSKVLGRIYPSLTIPVNENEVSSKTLTSDPVKIKEHDEDAVNLHAFTVGWAYHALLAQQRVTSGKCSISLPVFFAYAGNDQVADPKLNQNFAKEQLNSPDLEVLERPNDHHEILNETNRTEVYEHMAKWILKHA